MGLKPSVCIDAVLGEYSLMEALGIVKQSGIEAFEFWGWWDKNLSEILEGKEKYGLQISACCTKFISLVDPDTRDDYLEGLGQSIAAAQTLGTQTLISQVGDFLPGIDRGMQTDCLVQGLRDAAPVLEKTGITLVIEPLNELVDHAGYFLVRSNKAFEIIEQVNSPNVKVVFDIYHQQISEGHLIHNIRKNIDKIAHFHAAGNPGRHELTEGEINYPQVLAAIEDAGYDGFVGLEYWPRHDALHGLQTVANWFQR